MDAAVHRLGMDHPGDVSALEALIASGRVDPTSIVAIIGKTEGNGGVNDFTRGYFTQSLMAMLSRFTGVPAAAIARRVPCVLSGGTEGVLSPHYLVFCRTAGAAPGLPPPQATQGADAGRLAIGVAFSAPLPAEAVGRRAQIVAVADAVRDAMRDAGIDDPSQVAFVQVKCPCVTVDRARDAIARGQPPVSTNPGRSMAYARAAGAFGVALALGDLAADEALDASALLEDFERRSDRASISSGVEIDCVEVVVLGNSPRWGGSLRVVHRPMRDALDLPAVVALARDAGLDADPQVPAAQVTRVHGVLVKCEPDRRGLIRGARHTMLGDTDIDAQRHVRGALGGLVASVFGDGRIFVSGGAEHQGPDGGGLIALIAEVAP